MPTITSAMIHAGMLKKNIAPGLSRANTTSNADAEDAQAVGERHVAGRC